MQNYFEELLKARREAKKQPITLDELNLKQAQMNSPAWYKAISSMGTHKVNPVSESSK